MKEGFDSPTGYKNKSRDGAVVARRAHNPKVTGSSPVPATKQESLRLCLRLFLWLHVRLRRCAGHKKAPERSALEGFLALFSPPLRSGELPGSEPILHLPKTLHSPKLLALGESHKTGSLE